MQESDVNAEFTQTSMSNYFHEIFGNDQPTYSLEDAVEDIIKENRSGIFAMDEGSLRDYAVKCSEIAGDIKQFRGPIALTVAEIASITLFTAEFDAPNDSLYKVLNDVLRVEIRLQIRPFCRLIWLMLNGMKKCPSYECLGSKLVYRGISGGVDMDGYVAGHIVVWKQFSSCSSNLKTQETFLNKAGPRVMFVIELTTGRGKIIQQFSYHSGEEEARFRAKLFIFHFYF